ncbi:preprotein translocase subunit SecG [Candidatus Babeliales bacterium]|nr:preprotein translocase subunit SecG [Candidatus Babeliales bacterium]
MLPIIQLVIAILLIICILLQQRGSGLGAAFGGEGSVYRTKRGAEKFIFTFTVILAVLFLGLALINVYLSSQTPGENALPIESDTNILMEGEDIETKAQPRTLSPSKGAGETNAEAEPNNSNIFKIGEPKNSETP